MLTREQGFPLLQHRPVQFSNTELRRTLMLQGEVKLAKVAWVEERKRVNARKGSDADRQLNVSIISLSCV